ARADDDYLPLWHVRSSLASTQLDRVPRERRDELELGCIELGRAEPAARIVRYADGLLGHPENAQVDLAVAVLVVVGDQRVFAGGQTLEHPTAPQVLDRQIGLADGIRLCRIAFGAGEERDGELAFLG